MGRTAAGVRGIRIKDDDSVISLIALDNEQQTLLFATENGYGKRTRVEDFSRQGRGGQGVISIQTSERNGEVIGAIIAAEEDEVMLISNAGTLVRTPVEGISVMSRNTQGVTLIRLGDEEKLVQIEPVATDDDEDGEAEEE